MKIKTTNLCLISKEKTLRNDFVFQAYCSDKGFDGNETYSFNELFSVINNTLSDNDLQGDFLYCQIGDVRKDGTPEPVILNFNRRNLMEENYYQKIEKGDIKVVDDGNTLISFLLPQDEKIIGKFVRIDKEYSNIYFTKAFINLRTCIQKRLSKVAR